MYGYLVSRIYFYIACYYCVTWLCIAWFSLLTLPHRSSTLRDSAIQTTDGGIHSAEPSLLYINRHHLSPGGDSVGSLYFKILYYYRILACTKPSRWVMYFHDSCKRNRSVNYTTSSLCTNPLLELCYIHLN